MCNNVLGAVLLLLLLRNFVESFRFFSSDDGTYKSPRPFFTSSKRVVDDFFDGDLTNASTIINSHTFVFAMYYANFCGISRRMREPFEKAADFYRERSQSSNSTLDKYRIKFIAIDCFHHAGACRKTYKLNYFPHLFLYIKGTRGYQYFGPTITSDLISFVEKIRHPIRRIVTEDELLHFFSQHEFSILAHFNFSDSIQRQYHSLFVQTALKHIEYDNQHPVPFAVILNQTITDSLFEQSKSIPYIARYRFNESFKFYPNLTNNFTLENFFQWTLDQYTKPHVGWIVPKNPYFSRSPSIDKSTMLEPLINHDNLLIFLTSNKLDEFKLRYFFIAMTNCKIPHWQRWLDSLERLSNQPVNIPQSIPDSCCQSILDRLSMNELFAHCASESSWPNFDLFNEEQKEICSPVEKNRLWQRQCSRIYCRQRLNSGTSIYQHQQDEEENDDDDNIFFEKRLDKFDEDHRSDGIHFSLSEIDEKFHGMLCQTNQSWAFRLIDTRQYPNFIRNLGLNRSTAILLLQNKNENQFVLEQKKITAENFYRFLLEISQQTRPRSLITIPLNSTEIQQENIDHLIELTTDSFHSTVVNTRKHVLVVYYTKWCGFCRSIWPILFETQAFFRNFDNLLFTRIQADKHDLPWHLTVFSYPTIVLFPGENKINSIVFPTPNESLTSAHLIRFLLFYLYMDRNPVPSSCQRTNNSFLSMLSSTYVDFAQLTSIVKSCS